MMGTEEQVAFKVILSCRAPAQEAYNLLALTEIPSYTSASLQQDFQKVLQDFEAHAAITQIEVEEEPGGP